MASKSPRRVELLQNLGLSISVQGSTFAEDLDKVLFSGDDTANYALANAVIKAAEVYHQIASDEESPRIVIGADTVVVSEDGEILEKPNDADHAFEMLRKLSGKSHTVFTGLAIIMTKQSNESGMKFPTEFSDMQREYVIKFLPQGVADTTRIEWLICSTRVKFSDLSAELIQSYIDTEEPYDKAGGVSCYYYFLNHFFPN